LFGSGQDPGDTYCEYYDKSLGIVKCDEFLDQVSEFVSKKRAQLYGLIVKPLKDISWLNPSLHPNARGC
jgi:hypothetical protein